MFMPFYILLFSLKIIYWALSHVIKNSLQWLYNIPPYRNAIIYSTIPLLFILLLQLAVSRL